MNTQSITKVIAFASIVAGINMLSSCDSCNRKEESYDSTVETTTDTTMVDTTITAGDTTGNDQANATGTTGNTTGTGNANSTGATGARGTGRGETESPYANERPSTTSTVASGSGAPARDVYSGNDPIENTNSPAKVKGKPVDPGGTAGTGGGTGTGSTGNNSRVSKKADQID